MYNTHITVFHSGSHHLFQMSKRHKIGGKLFTCLLNSFAHFGNVQKVFIGFHDILYH